MVAIRKIVAAVSADTTRIKKSPHIYLEVFVTVEISSISSFEVDGSKSEENKFVGFFYLSRNYRSRFLY